MIHTEYVEPWQLRQAMAGYAAQGYPPRYGPHPEGGGFVVIIMVPDGAAVPDWHNQPVPPPRRRRSWRIDGRQVLSWLCVLVIVAGLGYLGYTMATSGELPTWSEVAANMPQLPAMQPAAPRGEPVVEASGWHWPWESTVISKPKPKPEPQGFRWPWESAQTSISQGFEQLTNGLMIVGVLFLLALVLWGIGLVRGAIGK